MSFFQITLKRSAIGLPKRIHGVLMSLGLRKREQIVFHPAKPEFVGMIMKVKELVDVKEVPKALTYEEVKMARTPVSGFEKIGNVRQER